MKSLRIAYSDVSSFVGRVIYLHDGEDIGSGAFELKEKAEIRILLPRHVGVVSVFAKIYNEAFSLLRECECKIIKADNSCDIYSLTFDNIGVGLYYLRFKMICAAGVLYSVRGRQNSLLLSETERGNCFQLSIADFKFPAPEKHYGGTIYHIFVDRFNRGGEVLVRSDAVMLRGWDGAIPEYPEYPGAHLENNTFFGGTLYGIIEKLDYIKSLGVTLIYLSPIFEAYSNHKYDTGDYMKVDDMFGGDEALKKLIAEANARGIGIILDGVFNHTGSDSIYFNAKGRYNSLGAYQSKNSPYYDWYDFQSHPNKYTSWWGIEILPRINPDIPGCGDFIAGHGGVIEKYAKMGISGFRLDVADELSDDFIARIKSTLAEQVDESLLYGEVWEDASNKIAYEKRKKYYLGSELDGVMNYPLRTGIIEFLRDKSTAALEYALDEVMFNAPKRIRDMQMNLLGTHDTERIITILAGKSSRGKRNHELARMKLNTVERALGVKLVKLAYTILATVPGIPTVFYGDEVGLEGYSDPFNRRPYPWQSADTELRDFYTAIGRIRCGSHVYRDGDFKLHHLSGELLVFEREVGGRSNYTVINNSDRELSVSLSENAELLLAKRKASTIVVEALGGEIISTTSNNKLKFDFI